MIIVRTIPIILCLLSAGCEVKEDPVKVATLPRQKVAPQTPSTATQFTGVCVLRPHKQVKLKAQVGGEVSAVKVEQGSHIKAGQVLATLNVENLKLRRERAEIDLNKLRQRAELLKFQISKSEREFEAVQGPAGSTPYLPRFGKEMAILVERKSDLEDNKLSQAAAQIDLRTFDDQISRSTVRAPFDGVILARNVEPGMAIGSVVENAGGGDVLFVVADPSQLVAQCVAKEADALLLTEGSTAQIAIDGIANSSYRGKVRSVAPIISNDAGVSRREFLVSITDPKHNLLSGMNATVLVDAQRSDPEK